MPSPAFTLSVPADEPYRSLVADTVRAYLRLIGRNAAPDVEAFTARVARAADRLAASGTDIDMEVVDGGQGVDVRLTCGGATETLIHTVAAGG